MATDTGAARARILEIYKLYRERDASSPLSQADIKAALEEKGIKAGKTTIGNDIAILKEAGLIKNTAQKGTSRDGRGAYGLFDDNYFEMWEIKLLLDAVANLPYLTLENVEAIRDKLLRLTSKPIREQADGIATLLPEQMYGTDESFVDTMKTLLDAINARKVLWFNYGHLGPNKEFVLDDEPGETVHPYAITIRDDFIYLLCHSEDKGKIVPFRLDRIRDPKILDRDATPMSKLPEGDMTEQVIGFVTNNTSNFTSSHKTSIIVKWHPETGFKESVLYDVMGVDNVTPIRGENMYRIDSYDNVGLRANLLRLGSLVEIIDPNKKSIGKSYLEELDKMQGFYKS